MTARPVGALALDWCNDNVRRTGIERNDGLVADIQSLVAALAAMTAERRRLESFIKRLMLDGTLDGEVYAEATLVIGFDPETVA